MAAELFFSIAHIADKVVIVILAIFSILTVGVSLERFFYLRPLYKKSQRIRLQLQLLYKYSEGDLNKVEEVAQDTSTPAGRVLKFALTHIKNHGKKGLSEVFNAGWLQEKPLLEGGISMLATIGSNAVYVGLLGTVFGIMRSFYDLSLADTANQQTVMAGISIALLATAMGLAVAIPSVMLYNYFRKKVNTILDTLENVKEACLAWTETQNKKDS